jgi:Na+-transporting NADH:ubiquinone oxidoreductase subunit B
VYGVLAGLLIVLFDTIAGPAIAPAAIVFACLLASLFAPLIDYLDVKLAVRRREARHG